jgi:hypothetical protein
MTLKTPSESHLRHVYCVYLRGDFLHPRRGRQKRKVYAEWGSKLKAKGNIYAKYNNNSKI